MILTSCLHQLHSWSFFKSIILKTNGGSSLELCRPNYRKLLIKIHNLIFDGEIRSFLDYFHIRLTCLRDARLVISFFWADFVTYVQKQSTTPVKEITTQFLRIETLT